MPSQFEQQMTTALASFYDEFAVAGTYNAPNSTSAIPVTIRVHRNDAHQAEPRAGENRELQTGEIMVLQSQLAKPVKDGRFTLEGGAEVWTIETTPMLKNGQHHCIVSRVGVNRLGERREKH